MCKKINFYWLRYLTLNFFDVFLQHTNCPPEDINEQKKL